MKHHCGSKLFFAVLSLGMLLFTLSCAHENVNVTSPEPPLKVGLSPDYPPLAFKADGQLKGVEVDFANAAGKEMGREVVFVEMPFQELIPALTAGTIDVIMSGMSITEERQRLVRFLPPYLTIGQMAIIRRDRIAQFGHPQNLKRRGIRIGYVVKTTGEIYVREQLPNAHRMAFASVEQGLKAVQDSSIDVFVHDAPTAWRIAQDSSESDLFSLYQPLTKEHLAWAVSKTDSYLYLELGNILANWKGSGYLQHILNQWIPVKITVQ